jgi:hypothetical protein
MLLIPRTNGSLLPNERKRHAGERALCSLSFGFGRL